MPYVRRPLWPEDAWPARERWETELAGVDALPMDDPLVLELDSLINETESGLQPSSGIESG